MIILTNPCNKANYGAGRKEPVRYVVLHYTGNNGDTAKNNAIYFARESPGVSAHYFTDEYDTVWRSVEDRDTAWHCGAKSYRHPHCRNANSVGVEMCSRKDGTGRFYIKERTVANAVRITVYLMKKHNIPPENILRHFDVTGKICPEPFVSDVALWEAFLRKLPPR